MEIIQGSPEWLQLRAGRVTASRVADIIAKTKSGPSASRTNYMAELVAERLTGRPSEGFSSAAMQWGTQTEPQARDAYAALTGQDVEQVGFVHHPSIPFSGASPDGLIAWDGLVEIKCPNTSTHIDTLLTGKVPSKYITQMMWQMACTGRDWCDFVSFDPRLPEHMQLFVKRVEADPTLIASLEAEVSLFLGEVMATITQLTEIYQKEAA